MMSLIDSISSTFDALSQEILSLEPSKANVSEKTFKIVLVGGAQSGKTTLLKNNAKDSEEHKGEFMLLGYKLKNCIAKLQLYDTIGLNLETLNASIFDAILVVFDLTDEKSLDEAKACLHHLVELQSNSFLSTSVYLCGTKSDIEKKSELSEKAEMIAAQHGLIFAIHLGQ